MPTTNLGLPLITGNMTANVPRDMNVLAEEIDLKVAGKQEIVDVSNDLATHLADVVKHITSAERTNWNGKALAVHTHTIGQVSELQTTLDSKINKSMINVPNGVIGLDENGNAPGNLTGKKVKIAEVNFAVTPGLTAEFIMPEGMKKVILEGEIRFEGGAGQNLTLQQNDKTVGNNYHQIRFGTTTSSANAAQITVFQSVGQSAIYVEIDADSPLLLTRAWGNWSHVVSQLIQGQEVDRLRKVKIVAQGTAPMVWGTVTVWGEPI